MTTTPRPELIARWRLVTRLIAFGDPRASSDLPPFARARRFIEYVCELDGASWTDLLRREEKEYPARDEAEILVRDTYITATECLACAALATESRRVVRRASDDGRIAEASAPRAARLVANATLALVLRDLIPDAEFRVLYGSFVML